VDEAVVPVAQEDEVRQVRAPAEEPVPEVVRVQALDAALRAPGARAAAVPAQKGGALCASGAPLPAADGQRLAILLEHGDDRGLAEHPASRRGRERRPALDVGAAGRGVVGQDGGVDVDDHLAAGRVTCMAT
jgi:hypothetical protein